MDTMYILKHFFTNPHAVNQKLNLTWYDGVFSSSYISTDSHNPEFFFHITYCSEILQISATSILGAGRPAFWGTKKEEKKNTQTEIILVVMQFIGVNLL